MPHQQLLVCPPDFYAIEYEINPWMRRDRPADPIRAASQWRKLTKTLAALESVLLQQIDPVASLPDLVFTANAGLMTEGRVLLSRFHYPERQREEDTYARWFEESGLTVIRPFEDRFFEGEGDALWLDETLFLGHGFRTEPEVAGVLEGLLGSSVVSLELVDPYYYHLDTCFMPVGPGCALWLPAAFSAAAQASVRAAVADLIEVIPQEARRFACNAVVVGETVVLNAGCPQAEAALQSRGFSTVAVELDEFIKAGGAAKCLVLYLDP